MRQIKAFMRTVAVGKVVKALGAFPRDERPTRYEIEPFDVSFHLRSESAWTPEVQLAVHIIHGERYLRPVDDCDRRCAAEIQANLRRLGVQPQRWSEGRAREEARREAPLSNAKGPRLQDRASSS